MYGVILVGGDARRCVGQKESARVRAFSVRQKAVIQLGRISREENFLLFALEAAGNDGKQMRIHWLVLCNIDPEESGSLREVIGFWAIMLCRFADGLGPC